MSGLDGLVELAASAVLGTPVKARAAEPGEDVDFDEEDDDEDVV